MIIMIIRIMIMIIIIINIIQHIIEVVTRRFPWKQGKERKTGCFQSEATNNEDEDENIVPGLSLTKFV